MRSPARASGRRSHLPLAYAGLYAAGPGEKESRAARSHGAIWFSGSRSRVPVSRGLVHAAGVCGCAGAVAGGGCGTAACCCGGQYMGATGITYITGIGIATGAYTS